jgi:hypothetical protein
MSLAALAQAGFGDEDDGAFIEVLVGCCVRQTRVWPIGSIIRDTGKRHRMNHESRIGTCALGGEALRERCQTALTESISIIFTACDSIRNQKNAGRCRNKLKHYPIQP